MASDKNVLKYQSSFLQIAFRMTVIFSVATIFAIVVCGVLLPNGMMDGGVTGVAILLSHTTGISLSILLALINLPFIIFAFFKKTKTFTFLSFFGIVSLAVMTEVFHSMEPLIEDDKLLALVIGSPVLGATVGLAIRFGGVLDGLEILAVYLSKKIARVSTGGFLFGCNIVIFGAGAFVFELSNALYSFVMFYIASQMISKVELHGSEIIRLSINSDKPDNIIDFLVSNGYQATFHKVYGAYTRKERIVIITNVPMTDVNDLVEAVQRFDAHAYFSQIMIKEIRGFARKGVDKDNHEETQVA